MDAAPAIGVVAHYNLLERLEPAGPGDLYRARDTRHGRTVTVRLLPPSVAAENAQSLLDQLSALGRLSHPNAIALFGCGQHEGRVFIAFERITGRSLRAEMAGLQMNVRRAVELAIQIADAVAEGHALGYLHNGLSPDSIGITARGHAKIPASQLGTAFGFAPSPGDTLIDYVAPEEAAGDPGDERSDVYSIGAVLYEMLTARRPMHRGASAPGASNTHVPPHLDGVVSRAVSPNPERRYKCVAELAAALRTVLPVLECPEPAMETGIAAASSMGRIIGTAVVIAAGLAVIAWLVMRS
jgi:serine/threonine protein kinase